MAEGVLKPAGLPTTRPLILPEPESSDRLTESSLISTLVTMGPTVSIPCLMMPSRKNPMAQMPRRRSTTNTMNRRITIFLIKQFSLYRSAPFASTHDLVKSHLNLAALTVFCQRTLCNTRRESGDDPD